ncbi:MAG TPA: Fic family protein [Acholeplasmataceae bacterium]|jgi:Fic family protein|nr:Fic family protein [Acholeplasmataceae bacterium]
MIDGELLTMRSTVKEKIDILDVPKEFLINQTYHGLLFEYDSITRQEVEDVVSGNTENIDPKKVLLINNHKNAFLKVVEMVKQNIPMDEDNLKDLHQILMDGLIDTGGLYRNVDISIKRSNHTPPSHIKVYDRMKKYFAYCLDGPDNDLFEYIAYCHLQLAKIHPFLDGNGRLARLVLNYYLMKYDFLPVIVTYEERHKYFELLEEFKVNKNINPFIKYLIELEKEALAKALI